MLMLLSNLGNGQSAIVDRVDDRHAGDVIARRLRDLGFVPGEVIRVVARAPWGGDPMLIQIGSTRFALRRNEAARVSIAELEEAL
jgi:ferrous iron transport protein A